MPVFVPKENPQESRTSSSEPESGSAARAGLLTPPDPFFLQRTIGNQAMQRILHAKAMAHPGSPLQSPLRADMERSFGRDFSHVRIHSGAAAHQAARDLNANAYTVGHHIVLGAGAYTSGTYEAGG